ncbi:MAG: hypothetical protein M1828_007651 [Chrysothrix sp. TS-e1954]|nr:MAG: hypothetical protein M1828_007651 [Chrysothrix sp. TS-e1954]
MAASHRRNLVRSRRRVADEGEDEDSNPLPLEADSHSDASNLSDADDNLDGDDSDSSEVVSTGERGATKPGVETDRSASDGRHCKDRVDSGQIYAAKQATTRDGVATVFHNTADTDAMVNGTGLSSRPHDAEELLFDETLEHEAFPADGNDKATKLSPQDTTGDPMQPTIGAQEAGSHKIANKPPLVPNRGGFFMHDQRSNPPPANGFMPYGRGRGRGRGQASSTGYPEPTLGVGEGGRWSHDLHDTVLDTKSVGPTASLPDRSRIMGPPQQMAKPSLSRSIAIGTIPLRVLLPSMQSPISFEKTPVKLHTRLPDLRPPLRRDKPVRVFLPQQAPRYIFPSVERSFIFIPRAQRPNQQRSRVRGTRHSSQYGSRRTSIYGGSNYTPSVAMSRRSSQARDGIISPAGSMMARAPFGAPTGPTRPIVKLPIGARTFETPFPPSNFYPGQMEGTQMYATPQHWPSYPLPSRPTFRENRAGHIPMHQPRPQKAVSVATIESPAPQPLRTPNQAEQQPFHQQVPASMNGLDSSQAQPFQPYHTNSTYDTTANAGSNFPSVPEQAIDAQPFQPGHLHHQAEFIPAYPMQSMPYYSAPDGQEGSFDHANETVPPVYMHPSQQGGYMMPMYMPQPSMAGGPSSPGQSGMFAHESNGMVYYYDPSQVPQGSSGNEDIPSANYSMPGMGGIMTPGPEGYYYPVAPPPPVMYFPDQ